VGFAEQSRFVNAVVALETELTPRQLLDELLAIELEFGRERTAGFQNGPRTLDLDILLFGDLQISEPELEIPHPRLKERAFVLVPLCEIAPHAVVAGCGKTVEELLLSQVPKCEGPGAPGAKAESDAVVRVKSDSWASW
jgi:2-amino-4-hydroxy-6-hydroxymethyldihydropteridine diphosphokinase